MNLDVGEMAPSFEAAALEGLPRYVFDSTAGRPILMLFLGSGRWQPSRDALALLQHYNALFDDSNAVFFGVTADPSDVAERRIAKRIPGIRWFLDYDLAVARLFGVVTHQGGDSRYMPCWLLLDATLRKVCHAPLDEGDRIFGELMKMIQLGHEQNFAPVLTMPRVLEPDLCRQLIDLYERNGGKDSGVMREENGLTVGKTDHSFKRRSDYEITDADLRALLLKRIRDRLVPQIAKAFQFRATRMERWIVACYDSASGGFFRPHRDNTTAGTAHRNFACTINLNAEDYAGGELRFPEFGLQTYRAPTGGAVVFSCSLLHEALPVTQGRRYAFLPFLYDEAGAETRKRSQALLRESGSSPVAVKS